MSPQEHIEFLTWKIGKLEAEIRQQAKKLINAENQLRDAKGAINPHKDEA